MFDSLFFGRHLVPDYILNDGRCFAHKNLLSLFGGAALVFILNTFFPQLKAVTFDQYGVAPVLIAGFLIAWVITEILYNLSATLNIDLFSPVLSVWAGIRLGAIVSCILSIVPLDKLIAFIAKIEVSETTLNIITIAGGGLTALITSIILCKDDMNMDMDNESIPTLIIEGIKNTIELAGAAAQTVADSKKKKKDTKEIREELYKQVDWSNLNAAEKREEKARIEKRVNAIIAEKYGK